LVQAAVVLQTELILFFLPLHLQVVAQAVTLLPGRPTEVSRVQMADRVVVVEHTTPRAQQAAQEIPHLYPQAKVIMAVLGGRIMLLLALAAVAVALALLGQTRLPRVQAAVAVTAQPLLFLDRRLLTLVAAVVEAKEALLPAVQAVVALAGIKFRQLRLPLLELLILAAAVAAVGQSRRRTMARQAAPASSFFATLIRSLLLRQRLDLRRTRSLVDTASTSSPAPARSLGDAWHTSQNLTRTMLSHRSSLSVTTY
jgi:hypothetical protein